MVRSCSPLPARSRYVFTVGSTGDSPVPSGDPPDGTEHGIGWNNAVFSHSSYTTTPPGESPGGAGGSPAPPSVPERGEEQGEALSRAFRRLPSQPQNGIEPSIPWPGVPHPC